MVAAVSRTRLAADLGRLGLRPGAVVMVHTRMSALGWVIGGSETVVRALLDVLGPSGTLAAYASWEDHAYHAGEWPEEHRRGVRRRAAGLRSRDGGGGARARTDSGADRTWPGARYSTHPEARVVAVGGRAGWLVEPHPDDDAYGARSPFARLVEAGGQVLMLGAPLETITLLHHAEAMARVPARRVTFEVATVWGEREYTDIDTSGGAFPYATLGSATTSSRSSRGPLWRRGSACAAASARGRATCSTPRR